MSESHLTDADGLWTIYVCQSCGRYSANAGFKDCECDGEWVATIVAENWRLEEIRKAMFGYRDMVDQLQRQVDEMTGSNN